MLALANVERAHDEAVATCQTTRASMLIREPSRQLVISEPTSVQVQEELLGENAEKFLNDLKNPNDMDDAAELAWLQRMFREKGGAAADIVSVLLPAIATQPLNGWCRCLRLES